jgi:transcriptional regulator with XRE-family HTH domain
MNIKNDSFTDRIQKIIELVGSADKLSHNAGMTASAISQYLSGKSDPTRKKLIALSKAAGVNIEWLATGVGPMREGEKERFSIKLLTIILEGLDELETSLGEKLTYIERATTITNTYDLYIDSDLALKQTKILIKDTIKAVYNFFTSLDQMIKTEKGQEQAIKMFTKIFSNVLSAEEAEFEAYELIGARLLERCLK